MTSPIFVYIFKTVDNDFVHVGEDNSFENKGIFYFDKYSIQTGNLL
jgi:hypothetical protein